MTRSPVCVHAPRRRFVTRMLALAAGTPLGLAVNAFAGALVFFSLLGVAIYVNQAALQSTLAVVRSYAPGSEIVLSFAVTEAMLSAAQQASRTRSMQRLAALGEPWISFYDPLALAEEVRNAGFAAAELLSSAAANARYFAGRADRMRLAGQSYMLAAST